MGFFKFLKATVKAVRTVSDTVGNILNVVEPAVQRLPGAAADPSVSFLDFVNASEEMKPADVPLVRVGLVNFEQNSLLVEGTNLKRLKTLLSTISDQADVIEEEGSERVSELMIDQFIWMQVCTNIIAEVTYQQELLLKTEPQGNSPGQTNWGTDVYRSLVNVAAGYALDYVATAERLDVLGEYARSGEHQNYGGTALGRLNNYKVTGNISLSEDDMSRLAPFPTEWGTYMRNLATGLYGEKIRDLYQDSRDPETLS